MDVLTNARCANCNSRLNGPFCQDCGQREEPRVPTIRSVFGEVINALFGLESKLWRSIVVLLIRPGKLTVDYLAGKRQRYTTPFRLYLLMSVLVFAYIAFTGSGVNIKYNGDASSEANIEATNTSNEASELDGLNDLDTDELNIRLGFLPAELEKEVVAKLRGSLGQIKSDVKAGKVNEVIQHFIAPLPKALLIFLPLMALLFKVYFLGRGKYYLEHLVFLLHNHAFVFTLLLISFFLMYVSKHVNAMSGILEFLIVILWLVYVPFYMFRSIRTVYSASRLATFLYYVLIFLSYLMLLIITTALTVVFSGYTYG